MTVFATILALLIGVTLGLLGGGGSILTVPVFVYALGIESKRAIAMSLPVVGLTALVGVARHARLGNVDLRTALPFGVAAMAGAYGGARLAAFLAGPVQLGLFALVMLAAAFSMLRDARLPEDAAAARAPSWGMLLPIGIGVGMVTGLVGAGGGFLIVPALVLLGRVPIRKAVGTSLLVIAMNTTAGFAGYRGVVDIDWQLVVSFAAAAGVGIIGGSALVSHVPARELKRGFALLLIVIGASILWQILSLL